MSMRSLGLQVVLGIVLGAGTPLAAQPNSTSEVARRAAEAYVSAGDRIIMHVLREPELSDTVTVTERGEAAFPKLGILPVTHLTIEQLQDSLRRRYTEYLRNPALEILVLRRVVVNGAVANPDVYWIDIAGSLRDAIALAGGVTEQGNPKKVYIVRGGKRTRVSDWDRNSTLAADLQSGDQVVVGRKSWWVLNALPAVSTAVVVTSLIISLTR